MLSLRASIRTGPSGVLLPTQPQLLRFCSRPAPTCTLAGQLPDQSGRPEGMDRATTRALVTSALLSSLFTTLLVLGTRAGGVQRAPHPVRLDPSWHATHDEQSLGLDLPLQGSSRKLLQTLTVSWASRRGRGNEGVGGRLGVQGGMKRVRPATGAAGAGAWPCRHCLLVAPTPCRTPRSRTL